MFDKMMRGEAANGAFDTLSGWTMTLTNLCPNEGHAGFLVRLGQRSACSQQFRMTLRVCSRRSGSIAGLSVRREFGIASELKAQGLCPG